MGMFGGDKKKDKDEGEKAKRPTQRRSRRIVTPGAKPGGGGGAAAGGDTASGQRRPGSSAVVRQRGRAPSGPAKPPGPRPAPTAPDPQARTEPIDLGTEPGESPSIEIGQAQMRPADHAPAGGVDLGGPTINKGDGQKPITASPDLEFGGDLDTSGPAGGSVNRSGDQPLIDFLVSKASLISADQAAQAKAKAESEDIPIDVACTRLGLIDEEQLVNALTQECWVPHLKVDKYEIRKKALDTIAEADARRFSVLPVDKLGSILNLAMINPLDVEAIRVLESKTGLDIKKVVATRSEIDQGIDKYYGSGTSAKEGGLDISQDHDSRRVTQMLSKMPEQSAPAPAPAPAPTAPAPAASDALGIDEVADIDDLLASDEAVKPSIVEPITIGDDELEPEIDELDTGDVELVGLGAAPAAEEPAAPPAPEPAPAATAPEPEPEPVAAAPSIDIGGLDLSASDDGDDPFEEAAIANTPPPSVETPEPELDIAPPEPDIAPPEPDIAPPEPAIQAPTPAAAARPTPPPAPAAEARPAPARSAAKAAGPVQLVPVMEEEFQHAITHGKSRIFEKWTSLQTRNRILNAVLVENELDPLLADLYAHGTKVAV